MHTRHSAPFPPAGPLPALALTLVLAAGPAPAQEADTQLAVPPGAELIDAEDLLAHVRWLSSDARMGRMTASPGQRAAAEYAAQRFSELGLEPLGDELGSGERSFFQRYPLFRVAIDTGVSEIRCGDASWTRGYAVIAPQDGCDLEVIGPPLDLGRIRGRVQLDDAAPEDLSAVLPVLRLELPGKAETIEQQFGLAFASLFAIRRATDALAKRGARVVVIALDDDDSGFGEVLNYLAVAPDKDLIMPGPRLARVAGGGQMAQMASGLAAAIPIVFTGAELTAALLAPRDDAAGDGGRLRLRVATRIAEASNVVGLLRGSDEVLAAEAVVYSAHMDHVGVRMDGRVFNGADDDASGTAALLEIAEAYARTEPRPKRSVLFLAVSGEELGLWGSAWFTAYPTWPADALVANVNTDMIGRSGKDEGYPKDATAGDEVMITPSHRHRMYSTIARDGAVFAASIGMNVLSGDTYYERSDHYNFAKRGIPAVFFSTGEHADYHQVGDTADKLDGEKMQRVARLAYWTGRAVADAAERPRRLGRQQGWTSRDD